MGSDKDARWQPWTQGQERPWLPGEHYDAHVPDTLDLAQLAEWGLNALTGQGDLEAPANGEIWITNIFNANPPYLLHQYGAAGVMHPKVMEPLAALRVMTGSALNLDAEQMMVEWLVRGLSDEDGLLYSLAEPGRPYYAFDCEAVHRLNNHVGSASPGEVIPGGDSDFAYIYAQSRMLNFMMAYHQYTQDSAWPDRIERMVDGIHRMASHRAAEPAVGAAALAKQVAYMPSGGGVNEETYGSCMPRTGWRDGSREPGVEGDSANEGSVFMDIGAHPGVLARWHTMSGSTRALELAEEFKNFIMLERFWGTDKDPLGKEAGAQLGHWEGHFFCRVEAIRGILEYAIVVDDTALMQFARNAYEWARHSAMWPTGPRGAPPIPAIGYFNAHCGCTTPRMVALAIRLSDAGLGDYWEDVDRYVRNHAVETQVRDADRLRELVETKPTSIIRPGIDGTDRAIERSLGSYAVSGTVTEILLPELCFTGTCCSCHFNWGLYYGWEAIVRCDDRGAAQVNLLLNRASEWMDIDSYLPYEGKVVIRNKTAKSLYLRMPLWVDKRSVKCRHNDRPIDPAWLGNSLHFSGLEPNDRVVAEFPMVERTETYHGYTIRFRGNTVVDIDPRDEPTGYQIYQRDHLKADRAPMTTRTRYVAPRLIEW